MGGQGGWYHAGGLLANQETGEGLLVPPLRFLLWGIKKDDRSNAQNLVKAGFFQSPGKPCLFSETSRHFWSSGHPDYWSYGNLRYTISKWIYF